jgi:NTF2-like protein (DUF6841)
MARARKCPVRRGSVDTVQQEITDMMRAYADDIRRQDPAAIAAHCHIPCLWLTDQGPVVFETRDQLVAQVTVVVDHLRTVGFTGGAYASLHARALGERTAMVSAAVVRYGEGGRELERVAGTYTL